MLHIVLRFEMTALRVLGHLPALRGCAACGRNLELKGRLLFGQLAGGLLCPSCRPGQRQVVSVTAQAMEALQQFAAAESDLVERIIAVRLAEVHLRKAQGALATECGYVVTCECDACGQCDGCRSPRSKGTAEYRTRNVE